MDAVLSKTAGVKNPASSAWIDLLKVILTVGIVCRHATWAEVGRDLPLFQNVTRGITAITEICVPLFFVLSGYLFFLNCPEKPTAGYFGAKLKRRVFTLLIPYLIAVVIAFGCYWAAGRYAPSLVSGYFGDKLYDPVFYNGKIGHILAQQCNRTEEAAPYLSEAMAKITADLCDTIIGYMNVFAKRGDFASAAAILTWGVTVFTGLRKGNKPNFLDKVSSIFLAATAQMQFETGDTNAARESLIKAKTLATFFDASPSYDESDVRFIDRIEGASVHDDMGATATDAIQSVVDEYEKEAFTALWESVAKQNSTGCGEDQSGAQPTV